MGAKCFAPPLKMEFRARVLREGCVEQEANGRWVSGRYVGIGLKFDLEWPAATGSYLPEPEPEPGVING
jgi:hypothetical protein